jgi:Cu-Zn family superoxide dismutase
VRTTLTLIALTIGTSACYWPETLDPAADDERAGGDQVLGFETPDEDAPTAVATLTTPEGRALGTVRFEPHDDGVRIRGTVEGLTPGSVHGLHVHENADCGDPAEGFEAAGGHFAPEGQPHGRPHEEPGHAGDLGNVTASADGIAEVDLTTDDLHTYGERSVLPRTLVLHAGADDLVSQPSGDAGDRMACAPIEEAR